MTNINCLAGIRCPQCGQERCFKIAAAITCLVTDDGSEPIGDHDWTYESHAQCPDCGKDGPLAEFRV
jgi:hypothetical protein